MSPAIELRARAVARHKFGIEPGNELAQLDEALARIGVEL